MSRRKQRCSIKLDRAEARLAALMSIQSVFDFGNGLSTVTVRQAIDRVKQALTRYNPLLSILKDAYRAYLALENLVSSLSEWMLNGMAMQSGKISLGALSDVAKFKAKSQFGFLG